MSFLKVSSLVFNTDYIARMEFTDTAVIMHVVVSQGTNADVQLLQFEGEEAAALKRWIERHADDVMRTPSQGIYS